MVALSHVLTRESGLPDSPYATACATGYQANSDAVTGPPHADEQLAVRWPRFGDVFAHHWSRIILENAAEQLSF